MHPFSDFEVIILCDEEIKERNTMGNYTREDDSLQWRGGRRRVHPPTVYRYVWTLKILRITARELPRALDNQCVVYGSHIGGHCGREGTDLIRIRTMIPFQFSRWRPQQGKVARLICVYAPCRRIRA